jgi:two-component system LytT family response regulator
MLKAVIIEDTDRDKQLLKSLLAPWHEEITVAGEAGTRTEAIDLINRCRPDVVFLDIQLKEGDGFEVLEALVPIDFRIIFTTSFETYAIRAIRLSALDYLVKPIEKEVFDQALRRLLSDFTDHAQKKKIEVLISNISQVKKIALPAQNSIKFVSIDNIVRCMAESNYTWFYLADGGRILVCRCLKEYEELLEPFGFFRVHQSHLVNLRYILEFKKECGGVLVMEDSAEIHVARRRKDLLLAAINRLQHKQQRL